MNYTILRYSFIACSLLSVATMVGANKAAKDSVRMQVQVFGAPQPAALSTASVSAVSAQDIRTINTPNLGNTLVGRLSGLMVSQTGSAPGYQDWPWLLIRGKGTFLSGDGNDCKVVVDGFETKWNNIIPDEIESVSVLKDAAALALYGMDGANGVLYIQTKRGRQRTKNSIAFNARFSMQAPTVLPRYVNNGEYAELYNQAMLSDGKDIASGLFKNEHVVRFYKEGTHPYLFADVDWVNEITKKQALTHDYTVTVNGGTQAVAYNVVLGYMNTQGLYAGTDAQGTTSSNWDLQRYSVRTNLDVQISKFLRSEVSLRATLDDRSRPNTDEATLWQNVGRFLPYPVRTENGLSWAGSQNYAENPAAAIRAKGYNSDNDRTIDANVKLIGDLSLLTPGLSLFGQVVFSNNYIAPYNKTRSYAYMEYIPTVDPFGFVDYSTEQRGSSDNNFSIAQPAGSQWNRYYALGGLTYDRYFGGRHHVSALSQYYQELYRDSGYNMPWAKLGVVGRVNYALDDKYVAELGYSYIGSSEYAPGRRFGFFPTISGAWLLSRESFMKELTAVDLLKLNASYGLIGCDNFGGGSRFSFRQYYIGTGDPYYIGNGFGTTIWPKKQGSVAYPNLSWEKAYKFNVALSGTLFRSLDFNVEYFHEHRKDIFVSPSSFLSGLIGGEYYYQNLGIAQNQGIEAELTYRGKVGRLGYFVSGNFSYAKNKVIDMKESPKAEGYLYSKGRPIDQPFVLEAIGFFKDQQDIANSPVQMFGVVQPGDVKYKNQNGDNIIDDNDRIPVGNPVYPRFYYGANAGISYRGFDLSIFMQGVGGRTVSLLNSGFMTPFVNNGVKPHPDLAAHYWTPERGDASRYPRLTTESNNNNYRASTLWQRDGSYFRIKNVELGYTFPARMIKGISGIRLFANVVNPFTFSALAEYNIDPEINSPYKYPLMKSANFGLNVQF